MHTSTRIPFLPPDSWARVVSEEVLHRDSCGCVHTLCKGLDREGRPVHRTRWVLCDRCGRPRYVNGRLS